MMLVRLVWIQHSMGLATALKSAATHSAFPAQYARQSASCRGVVVFVAPTEWLLV